MMKLMIGFQKMKDITWKIESTEMKQKKLKNN